MGLKINYETFRNNIKAAYINESLKVVIASRSFKYSEYLDLVLNTKTTNYNQLTDLFRILYEIRNEQFDNSKLFTNNDLTSKILGMNFVDTLSTKEMIKYNGFDFK